MLATKKTLLACVSLITLLALLAACGPTPEPQVVKETVVVEGTTEVVEVEKVVTPTAPPARDVIIVGLSAAPDTLDPAAHPRSPR